jgi:4-hydroxy-tetrahydrodipicolinate synthase
MVRIHRASRDESSDASADAGTVREVGRLLDRLTFPLNVAAALEARGFDPGVPKSVVSTESRARYERIVAELAALFDRRGLARAAR